MEHLIRRFDGACDADVVAALSVRAWEPVYESMRQALGDAVFDRLYPDWRVHQEEVVRHSCATHAQTTWVVELDGAPRGFVVVVLDDSPVGQIDLVAVDPDFQRDGLGRALTLHAIDRIRDAGKSVAMVGTGGDPGHLPARRTYESVGMSLYPIARYFMPL